MGSVLKKDLSTVGLIPIFLPAEIVYLIVEKHSDVKEALGKPL